MAGDQVALDILVGGKDLANGARSAIIGGEDEEGGPAANSALNRQLWLRDLDALGARPIPGTEDAMAPFFSRDGASIGFVTSEPGDLRVVPPAGGPVRTVVTGTADPWGGDWGPDGRIYFTGANGQLLRISPGGTAIDTLASPDRAKGETEYDFAHVVPNGKGVVVEIWHSSIDDSEIGVVSLETGTVTTLVPGVTARYLTTGHLLWITADGMLMAAPFDLGGMALSGPSMLLEQQPWFVVNSPREGGVKPWSILVGVDDIDPVLAGGRRPVRC